MATAALVPDVVGFFDPRADGTTEVYHDEGFNRFVDVHMQRPTASGTGSVGEDASFVMIVVCPA